MGTKRYAGVRCWIAKRRLTRTRSRKTRQPSTHWAICAKSMTRILRPHWRGRGMCPIGGCRKPLRLIAGPPANRRRHKGQCEYRALPRQGLTHDRFPGSLRGSRRAPTVSQRFRHRPAIRRRAVRGSQSMRMKAWEVRLGLPRMLPTRPAIFGHRLWKIHCKDRGTV